MLVVLGVLLAVYFLAAPMWSDEGEETTAPLPTHTVAVIDHNLLNSLELESEEDVANMEKMLDKFNEDDDVNAVYHNWDM